MNPKLAPCHVQSRLVKTVRNRHVLFDESLETDHNRDIADRLSISTYPKIRRRSKEL